MVPALVKATLLAATLGIAATFFYGNFGITVTLVVVVKVEAAATLFATTLWAAATLFAVTLRVAATLEVAATLVMLVVKIATLG